MKLIVERELRTEPPNALLVNLNGEPEARLTANEDLFPELTACRRVQLRAKRKDGKSFNVKLTVEHKKHNCPVILTLYPEPFESQDAYDAGTPAPNPNAFPSYPRGTYSVEALVLAGYAVAKMDCPIFASVDEPFEHYLSELGTNLEAVRSALADSGVVDSGRMAIFGYSFGGLAAATAVTQTDYFEIGFAVAPGIDPLAVPSRINYRRRPVWNARETFLELLHARMHPEKAGPIVLFHGAADTNPMTPASATIGYYQGLLDAGNEAALYLYPDEGHVFLAKETHLDMTARVHEWLKKKMPVEP